MRETLAAVSGIRDVPFSASATPWFNEAMRARVRLWPMAADRSAWVAERVPLNPQITTLGVRPTGVRGSAKDGSLLHR